jgi:hypothetical protein
MLIRFETMHRIIAAELGDVLYPLLCSKKEKDGLWSSIFEAHEGESHKRLRGFGDMGLLPDDILDEEFAMLSAEFVDGMRSDQ